MLDKNKGKSFVGKVSDYQKRKGWFFGNFADNGLIKSDLVEIAWQNISEKEASPEDKHIHTSSVEINVVISGTVNADINGKHFTIQKGEFYVIWPETVIENLSAGEDTQLIVIKAPSINDKQILI
ncbi:MAG: hypothetical protein ACREHC_03050 [Candidatus Levyibacteriota bacterium]